MGCWDVALRKGAGTASALSGLADSRSRRSPPVARIRAAMIAREAPSPASRTSECSTSASASVAGSPARDRRDRSVGSTVSPSYPRRSGDSTPIIPKTLAAAVKADTVFLAVGFESHGDVAKVLRSWKGKTIIDVTNACGVSADALGGQPSSKAAEKAFAGARLVKGFNHLVAAVLDQDPSVHGGMRVVFLASDDEGAAAEVAGLAKMLGFSPIKLGACRKVGCMTHARRSSLGVS